MLAQAPHEFLSRNTSVELLGSLSCIVFLLAATVAEPMTTSTRLVSAGSAPAFTQMAAKAPSAAVPGSLMVLPKMVASRMEFPWRALTRMPVSPYRLMTLSDKRE